MNGWSAAYGNTDNFFVEREGFWVHIEGILKQADGYAKSTQALTLPAWARPMKGRTNNFPVAVSDTKVYSFSASFGGISSKTGILNLGANAQSGDYAVFSAWYRGQ